MTSLHLRIAVAAALTVLASQAASAADYTFRIPVDFKSLPPEVNKVTIRCQVQTSDHTLIAFGFGEKPVLAGKLSGTIDVAISKAQGDTRVASLWSCDAYLNARIGANDIPYSAYQTQSKFANESAPPGVPQDIVAASGTPVKIVAEGQFPQ